MPGFCFFYSIGTVLPTYYVANRFVFLSKNNSGPWAAPKAAQTSHRSMFPEGGPLQA